MERQLQSGQIEVTQVVDGVQPKYPEEALKDRITGYIVLHVVLEKDGTVRQIEVVSGHPMFAQAAIDAVKQWKYQPTLSNGEPIEADRVAYVKFALASARPSEVRQK